MALVFLTKIITYNTSIYYYKKLISKVKIWHPCHDNTFNIIQRGKRVRKYFRKRKISSEYIILIAAFIVLSANLRAPLTALPAVIDDIRSDLHIDSVLAGTLTTIPVLCFGLLVPLASIILKRVSIERAIFIVLLGVILGTLLRSFGDFTTIWVGTLLLGGALSLGNIVSLMVIARDFRHNSGLMTGIYVMAMSIGATLTSALTAPLASILGWQIALSCWSILALLGIVLWAKVNNNKKELFPHPKKPLHLILIRQS